MADDQLPPWLQPPPPPPPSIGQMFVERTTQLAHKVIDSHGDIIVLQRQSDGKTFDIGIDVLNQGFAINGTF